MHQDKSGSWPLGFRSFFQPQPHFASLQRNKDTTYSLRQRTWASS
jgi:hypothetical protein